jgi:hypothetical protein
MKKLPKYVTKLVEIKNEYGKSVKCYRLYRVVCPFFYIPITTDYYISSDFGGATTLQTLVYCETIDEAIEYLNRWVCQYELNGKKYITNKNPDKSLQPGNTGQEILDLICKIFMFGFILLICTAILIGYN